MVVDEAYIEFTRSGLFYRILDYTNLVVCQTFSKAQGMAGARLGMAFAHPELIRYLNRIKAPYNLNSLTLAAAMQSFGRTGSSSGASRFYAQGAKTP